MIVINKDISTVLIIDDNEDNIKVAGNIIKRNNFNVLVALNGKNGIDIACLRKPDAILLDIQMPEMDGFQVCSILKENPETKDIPVIFLTARNDDETIEKVFRIGASDYTKKPFSEIELISRIKSHVSIFKSEKKILEALEEAKKASQAKSNFLSNISHEIRTPLNSIIGYSELLLEEEENFDKAAKLNTIVSSGKHLLALINNLLDFSKIESGKMELNESLILTNDLVKKIQEMFLIFKEKKGLSFSLYFCTNIPDRFIGDRQKIEQILINLINNAFKFTEKGSITVKFSYEDDFFNIRVCDTGIGIKEENKDKIFLPFDQAEKNITAKYGGTGLGLTISRQLANLMGGDLTFQSEYNKGSEFVLSIKIKSPEENRVSTKEVSMVDNWIYADSEISDLIIEAISKIPEKIQELKEIIKSSNLEEILFSIHKMKGFFGNFHMKEFYEYIEIIETELQKKSANSKIIENNIKNLDNLILQIPLKYLKNSVTYSSEIAKKKDFKVIVVDDVEDNRNLAALILKKLDVSIDFSVNGKELLEKMSVNHYDLILLDVQMPELDGKETIKKIRENPNFDKIQVFALSAQTRNDETMEMIRLGCDGYLTKPINKNLLRETVLNLIEKRGVQDDL